jgi:predicted Zn-dependent peptidase
MPLRFPAIAREELSSGLRIWALQWDSVPVVTAALLVDAGSANDPAHQWGLASVSADLLDEGAAGRDAVQLSDAFARLGTHFDIDVGQDSTLLSFTTLSRNLDAALGLVADVVGRPHLAQDDLERIRELRVNRLKQLRTSPTAVAERAFLTAVFGPHPYGHGTIGTTRSLEAIGLADVRQFSATMHVPERATLIVAGAVAASAVIASARTHLSGWRSRGSSSARMADAAAAPPAPADWLLVDRPGAQQSELRIGHIGARPRA